jgi:N-acetylmuramoyl-L-alanine amidase
MPISTTTMTNRTVRRLRSSTRAVARLLACMPLLAAPLVPGAARAAGPDAPPPSARYIVVDTGHTPAHPGATGASGRVEYRYNLDLSTAVADTLVAHGDRVLRTSADGREIALDQRSTQAPDANLFVSIHHDSMQQQFIDAGGSANSTGSRCSCRSAIRTTRKACAARSRSPSTCSRPANGHRCITRSRSRARTGR